MDRSKFAKMFANNRASILKKEDRDDIIKNITRATNIEKSDLLHIKGVGEATVKTLLENGITNGKELKEAGEEKIRKLITNPLSVKALLNSLNK